MSARFVLSVVFLVCLVVPMAAHADDGLRFEDEILVVDQLNHMIPVDLGQTVAIFFPAGELDIRAADVTEVQTELHARCRKISESTCDRYRKQLRFETKVVGDRVTVRLVGLSLRKISKVGLEGRILFPRWAPLELRMGFGDVDVDAGDKDVTVAMKIGDLTVHADHLNIASAKVGTRIGDAVISGPIDAEGKRPNLIGAKSNWLQGPGTSVIEVKLGIGDAKIYLD